MSSETATLLLLGSSFTPKKSKWTRIIVLKCKFGILLGWNRSDPSSRHSIEAQQQSSSSITLPSNTHKYQSLASFEELEHWYTEAIENCTE